jgi:hypothetical protein
LRRGPREEERRRDSYWLKLLIEGDRRHTLFDKNTDR